MALVSVNWSPDEKQLRSFGGVALLVFGLLGASAFFRHHLLGVTLTAESARVAGGVLLALAGGCGLAALALPKALKPLFIALSVVTAPIGFVVSHLLLAAIFFVVLTPIGLVMKLMGHDPLTRRLEKERQTYWEKRPPVTDVARYFRQY